MEGRPSGIEHAMTRGREEWQSGTSGVNWTGRKGEAASLSAITLAPTVTFGLIIT